MTNEASRITPHGHAVLKPKLYGWIAMFVVGMVFTSATALAQLPTMVVDDAGIFEGNSGTTILKLPVRFVGTQNLTVTGFVSAIPMTGAGFNTPIGGESCGGGVDFLPFTNSFFSIPPNTPNGTLTVNITVCGDATIEPDEQIFVFISNVAGADCSLEGTCSAIGGIVNDDGPPAIRINDIVVSTIQGIRKTTAFTVSLHHPSTSPVSVHFATRNGTAKAVSLLGFGSYFATSGKLTIPENTLTWPIPVTITGLGSGTFFMDLSTPVNGTIADQTGRCTIRIIQLTIGSFEITPDDADVPVGEVVNYSATWTLPEGGVWRDLNTIDVRFRKGNQVPLWLRWDEATNMVSVCQSDGDDAPVCAADLPGNPSVLETRLAQVYLANSSVIGSGPTGRSVTLNLAIAFRDDAAGHLYDVELAATDDLGRQDDFVAATTIHVKKAGKQ